MLNRQKLEIKNALGIGFSMLECAVVEVENVRDLCKHFSWVEQPVLGASPPGDTIFSGALDCPDYTDYTDDTEYPEALNLRYLHDAEALHSVAANIGWSNAIEIDADDEREAESVYDDTVNALATATPGTFVVWHDFSLQLAPSYSRIHEVCAAIEELYRARLLHGPIYHLQDSWVGLYPVPAVR